MSIFYNHSYKIIFIHIPKCGGLSIRKFSNIKFEGPYFDRPNIVDYSVIGMCRHPIDRFLSAMHMFMDGTDCFDKKNTLKNLDIDYAISILLNDAISPNLTRHKNKLKQKEQEFKHHIIPITHPSNHIDVAQHIIRYESYVDDCRIIFNKIGIDNIIIPHKNISNKKQKIILSNKHMDILYGVYKKDFITFGYKL